MKAVWEWKALVTFGPEASAYRSLAGCAGIRERQSVTEEITLLRREGKPYMPGEIPITSGHSN